MPMCIIDWLVGARAGVQPVRRTFSSRFECDNRSENRQSRPASDSATTRWPLRPRATSILEHVPHRSTSRTEPSYRPRLSDQNQCVLSPSVKEYESEFVPRGESVVVALRFAEFTILKPVHQLFVDTHPRVLNDFRNGVV